MKPNLLDHSMAFKFSIEAHDNGLNKDHRARELWHHQQTNE